MTRSLLLALCIITWFAQCEEIFFASMYFHGHVAPLSAIANYMHKHYPQHRITFASELPALKKLNVTCDTVSMGATVRDLSEHAKMIANNDSPLRAIPLFLQELSAISADEFVALHAHFALLKVQNRLPKLIVGDMGTFAARMIALDFGIDYVMVHPALITRAFHKIYEPSVLIDTSYPTSLVDRFKNLFLPLPIMSLVMYNVIKAVNVKRSELQLPAMSILHMFSNPSVTIYGTVPGFEYTFPVPPNVFTVGSLVPAEHPPLTSDLHNFLQQGPAVYIGFGSMFQLTTAQFETVLSGVEKSGVRAIWAVSKSQQESLNSSALTGMSSNIKLVAWAPQIAVLAHENITLFITHCGGNSVHEGLHFGKPLIGIPLGADQAAIADRINYRQVGIIWNKKTLESKQIAHDIRQVLDTPQFTMRAKHISQLIRYAGGVARAAQLIDEFAHVGISHVQPLPVAWYEVWYLDIAACIVLPLVMMYWLLLRKK